MRIRHEEIHRVIIYIEQGEDDSALMDKYWKLGYHCTDYRAIRRRANRRHAFKAVFEKRLH